MSLERERPRGTENTTAVPNLARTTRPLSGPSMASRVGGRPKPSSALRRVDEDYTAVAAGAGDASPAVMGDGLNPLTMR
jgi:hypothetical protein